MPKIMLIEDDMTMLSLLQTLLQMEGFQIVKFNNENMDGILATMQQEKPSLALIDVNLREGSGFDLLKRIRQDADLRMMKVLMSSGMDYSSECIKEGADDFILKPYMPDDLIDRIHSTLGA